MTSLRKADDIWQNLVVLRVLSFDLILDSFTVPLHSPNGRHACRYCCAKGLSLGSEKRWEFPPVTRAHNEMGTRLYQFTFRPTNHKRVTPASWRPFLYPTESPIATKLGLCSSLFSVSKLDHSNRRKTLS